MTSGERAASGSGIDNPVELLLERLHRQSREYRRGWFSRPMFVTLAAVLFLISVILVSRQHWALSLHDPLATNPLYVQSSRIVAVMACLWFYFNLSMLMAFSRTLSAASQGLQLLSTGRTRSNALRIDDLLQGNPLDSATILDGLTAYHRRRIAPLLWFPCFYVLLGAVLKFPLPLNDHGKLQWHWEFLLIPLVAPLFHFICMAVFRLLLHVSILIGRRIAHPVGQQLMLWLLIGSPLMVILLLQLVIRGQGITEDSAKLLSLAAIGLMLMVPLLLSRLLRGRALAAIEAVASGRHDRQAVEARSSAGSERDSAPSSLLKPTYAVVLGLPVLLAASVFIHTLRMQPLQADTGDPFYDWYFGYAQQTVERLWMQRLDSTPTDSDEQGMDLGGGHYYIHELMQQAEPQFSDDPRWQRLRYELLGNASEEPLAFEFDEASGNAELARLLLKDSIARGVDNTPGELWLFQSRWNEFREAEISQPPGLTTEQADQRHAELLEEIKQLAARLNEAAPLYWIAVSDTRLEDVERISLIRDGNAMQCSFHTGHFRMELVRSIPAGMQVQRDRILCAMQPFEHMMNENYTIVNSIELKKLIERLAAQQDLAALDEINRMLCRLMATEDTSDLNPLILLSSMGKIGSEVQANCKLTTEQAQALTEYNQLRRSIQDDNRNMRRNWPWDITVQLDRTSAEYLPDALPDALFAPLAALEYRLSLGRLFASSFHYEINTMTQQLIDELEWNRRHMDEIERLSQFDFETVSWKEPEAAEEL
ncbi:hypothetical protein KDL29_15640 [bacterium]|nr:hypothetical protein [bacterium]